MTSKSSIDWKYDFGLSDLSPPHFLSSVDQLDDVAIDAPQPHALRIAFKQLGIDGVLCQERSPVIYFRQVEKIEPADIIKLHSTFWNQGVAPILVIVAPTEVHVYSGLIPPNDTPTKSGHAAGFVETLNRVSDRLRSFILSIESGEYFHIHQKSFDPRLRVDRGLLRNLQTTRDKLGKAQGAPIDPHVLDALLCRLVFTCYLFDRGVIAGDYLKTLGIQEVDHLKDILAKTPKSDAKADLYRLFGRLGGDFNGDLFSHDLAAEGRQVRDEHIEILDRFFHGAEIKSGQRAFWPYDFGVIPIEAISAIYEHFLKASGEEEKKETGAFYTPRFLAEFVLDVALEGETSLLDKRFLDPACGSGIFLVGLFNRLAEEWKRKNPGSRYESRANGLMRILRDNLHGIDRNPTACQITAFSLYLAFLDQLSPPDIQKLLGKWDRLPHLVGETIHCADFFTDVVNPTQKFNVIVGNPPWGSVKDRNTPAVRWCAERQLQHPDRQMATAFIWKAPAHLEEGGKVCFVLPHGTIFNHQAAAIAFQQSFFRAHAVDRVVNLTDYQCFLFEESRAPAIIVRYRKEKPKDSAHIIDYWAPKTDWTVTQAEIINISPQDRCRITVREVLADLRGDDAPQIWKRRFRSTPRDWRLLDRLSLYPRLRDMVRQPRERASDKRWLMAEGFQPFGLNDLPKEEKTLTLPSRNFVSAKAKIIDLFLRENDCIKLDSDRIQVRRMIRDTSIFRSPLVLVTEGLSWIAFADFDVSFQHAVRGIHGPIEDSELLIFLAAYLSSDLARYFLFHTSSNWGVSRSKVHVEELLRAPFPTPKETQNPDRCMAIVTEIAAAVKKAADDASRDLCDREGILGQSRKHVASLIEEYFDIDDIERMLITDTMNIIIPSVRPSRDNLNVPAIETSSQTLRHAYAKLLCERLNGWANKEFQVHGKVIEDTSIGIGLVVLEKTKRGEHASQLDVGDGQFSKAMEELRLAASRDRGTYQLMSGLLVFHKNRLFITKPLGQRFWTNTAALNDADEIAASIIMRSSREGS